MKIQVAAAVHGCMVTSGYFLHVRFDNTDTWWVPIHKGTQELRGKIEKILGPFGLRKKSSIEKILAVFGGRKKSPVLVWQRYHWEPIQWREVDLPTELIEEIFIQTMGWKDEMRVAIRKVIDEAEGPQSLDQRRRGTLNQFRRMLGIPEV